MIALPATRMFLMTASAGILCVNVLDGAAGLYGYFHTNALSDALLEILWLNQERNVPTFFSFLLLLVSTSLLGVVTLNAYSENDRWRHNWLLLSLIFLLLAFDEAGSLHEELGRWVPDAARLGGAFTFTWVLVAIPAIAVFAVANVRFLLSLERRIAAMMIASGAICIFGAVGIEMAGAYVSSETNGVRTIPDFILVPVEETMEMTGIMLFSATFLHMLHDRRGRRRPTTPAPDGAVIPPPPCAPRASV